MGHHDPQRRMSSTITKAYQSTPERNELRLTQILVVAINRARLKRALVYGPTLSLHRTSHIA